MRLLNACTRCRHAYTNTHAKYPNVCFLDTRTVSIHAFLNISEMHTVLHQRVKVTHCKLIQCRNDTFVYTVNKPARCIHMLMCICSYHCIYAYICTRMCTYVCLRPLEIYEIQRSDRVQNTSQTQQTHVNKEWVVCQQAQACHKCLQISAVYRWPVTQVAMSAGPGHKLFKTSSSDSFQAELSWYIAFSHLCIWC